MRTVDFYLDEARKRGGFTSDRSMDKGLGLTPGAVCSYRIKRAWPSDETIIKLAKIAGISPEAALLDLNVWRSTGSATVYYQLLIEQREKLHTQELTAAE